MAIAVVLLIALIALVAVLTVAAYRSSDDTTRWGRLLQVANGPAGIFGALLGGLFGFGISNTNTRTERHEKFRAQRDLGAVRTVNQRLVEDRAKAVNGLRATQQMIPSLDEIRARRGDDSTYLPEGVASTWRTSWATGPPADPGLSPAPPDESRPEAAGQGRPDPLGVDIDPMLLRVDAAQSFLSQLLADLDTGG